MEVIGHQSKPIENPQKYITECKCGAIICFTRNDMHSNHISMSYDIKDKEPLFVQCPECHKEIQVTEEYTTRILKKKKMRFCAYIRGISEYDYYRLKREYDE